MELLGNKEHFQRVSGLRSYNCWTALRTITMAVSLASSFSIIDETSHREKSQSVDTKIVLRCLTQP